MHILADLHCDTALQINRGYDLGVRHNRYHIDIPRLKEGGVNLQVFAVFVDPSTSNGEFFNLADRILTNLKSELIRHPEDIQICYNETDVRNTIQSGSIAAVLALENGSIIENSIEKLEYFFKQGVRMMTLTHSKSTEWCSSSSDDGSKEFGLREFGNEVVRHMNDIGMIVDVSHISERSFFDVLNVTTKPVLASHSSLKKFCSHDRNLTDEQLKALSENGGMTGINFCAEFLDEELSKLSFAYGNNHKEMADKLSALFHTEEPEIEVEKKIAEYDPFIKEWNEHISKKMINIKAVVEQIIYVKELVGAEYVGLGSDFDGIWHPPYGLDDCSKMNSIVKLLREKDLSDNEIDNISGENFMRIFKKCCG